MTGDARDIARMLARRAPQLAAELLPRGKREGDEWRVGSVQGEPGRSCSIRLTGAKAGVWADFAAGIAGDAVDLVAQVHFSGDLRKALAWSRRWLGLGAICAPAPQRAASPPTHGQPDEEAEARRRSALRLFLNAQETLRGTPAECYLAARGIDLSALQRQPRALRFHPAVWNVEARAALPCLLAAVTDAAGRHVATHRTWLGKSRDGIWQKATVATPKKSLGYVAGGCVRLWRGASGRSMAQASPGESVIIAEGIETALSVVVSCPELRVVSSVSVGNMRALAFPPAVTEVIIAADHDEENPATRRALDRAADRFLSEGRKVRIAWPPAGQDYNDLLRMTHT